MEQKLLNLFLDCKSEVLAPDNKNSIDKSAVQLSCAYDESINEYVYINEAKSHGKTYICPHCKQALIVKKGSVRQHHFAHDPNNTMECGLTKETALHWDAKIYLYKLLKRQIKHEAILYLSKSSMLNNNYNEFFFNLDCEKMGFKFSKIPGFMLKEHELETIVGEIIPDVFSYTDGTGFGWEIFVTHQLDDNKIEKYKQINIPFIELRPIRTYEGGFDFEVTAYHGFDIVKPFESFEEQYFNENKERLLKIYQRELDEAFVNKIREEITKSFRINQESELKNKIYAEQLPIITKDVEKRLRDRIKQEIIEECYNAIKNEKEELLCKEIHQKILNEFYDDMYNSEAYNYIVEEIVNILANHPEHEISKKFYWKFHARYMNMVRKNNRYSRY